MTQVDFGGHKVRGKVCSYLMVVQYLLPYSCELNM